MVKPPKSMDYAILNLIEILERKGMLKLSAQKYRSSVQRAAPRYNPDELLRPKQAAAFLKIREKTLAHWRLSGNGPLFVRTGGYVSYRFADLLAFVQANTRTSTSDKGGHSR
ncbi:hypothetical protein PV773_13270 [Mesorhizobium sp. CC13]|uniref:hypothetical protein n=1 Tax=Mesorhizobium sp. CC13 TaxID=3029194 RepID=UPI0032657366